MFRRLFTSRASPIIFRRPVVTATVATAGAVTYNLTMPSTLCKGSSPDLKAISAMIEDIIEDEKTYNPSVDNAPGCLAGGGDIAPVLIRLAWHCSGSWDEKAQNGGSNGATMRFSPEADHGGNAGLGHARNMLEPVKAKHPDISYADLYILAGKVAIESMGGPDITFHTGRTDAAGPPADKSQYSKPGIWSPDGRLPDGDKGPQHLRDIFYRMGFNDQEIVALSGAHATGRCHTDRSGFWGPWTYSPSTFSNEYFRLLLEEKWTPKKTHNGQPWDPAGNNPQLESEDKKLMMLLTDVALIQDPKFKPWVEKYAKDEQLFFNHFASAWQKLTELGCDGILDGGSSNGWMDRKLVLGIAALGGVAAIQALTRKPADKGGN